MKLLSYGEVQSFILPNRPGCSAALGWGWSAMETAGLGTGTPALLLLTPLPPRIRGHVPASVWKKQKTKAKTESNTGAAQGEATSLNKESSEGS